MGSGQAALPLSEGDTVDPRSPLGAGQLGIEAKEESLHEDCSRPHKIQKVAYKEEHHGMESARSDCMAVL